LSPVITKKTFSIRKSGGINRAGKATHVGHVNGLKKDTKVKIG